MNNSFIKEIKPGFNYHSQHDPRKNDPTRIDPDTNDPRKNDPTRPAEPDPQKHPNPTPDILQPEVPSPKQSTRLYYFIELN